MRPFRPLSSLGSLFRRGRRYDDLSESIEEHLAEKIDELMEDGLSREEATYAARRAFGNATRVEERSREVWQWPRLESTMADVKFALRQLAKSPAFTVAAVLTLALGISANATMFSMVSAYLMPHLPGADPQKIVVVSAISPDDSWAPEAHPVSAPSYMEWRGETRLFSETAATHEGLLGALGGDKQQPEAINYAAVTPNYFGLFREAPALGRVFDAGEDQLGRNHVVMLTSGLWKRRFNSDPAIVGRTLRLNREDYAIIGVMPADFRLMGFTPQLWTPMTLTAADLAPAARKDRYYMVFARLAPGVTLDQARAEMRTLGQKAAKDYPDTDKRWGIGVRTLPDYLVYGFGIRTAMAIMMTVVGFVLLLACANVAGLLLTRATGRQKEMAIRVSLGASRMRIVRQLLTEGFVIAMAGGAAGLGLSVWGIRWLAAHMQFNDAIAAVPITLDRHVVLYALGVSFAAAVLSSLAPALQASRADVQSGLRSEGRSASPGKSHSRMRAILVGGEFTLALFLLIGSVLLIEGVYTLEHQRLGFRSDHLLTAGMVLDEAHYKDTAQQLQFVRDVLPKLRQIPGVEDAAVASDLPATGAGVVPIRFEGEAKSPAGEHRTPMDVVVTPEYFNIAGVTLLRGRTFTDNDDAQAPRVIVVNQQFVHDYLGGADALGKRIQLQQTGAEVSSEIVGVVSDVKFFSMQTEVRPEVYEAFRQRPVTWISLLLRTRVDPNSLIPAMRHAVAEVDPELPLMRTMSMDGVLDAQHQGNPLFLRLLEIFSALALLLAAIGVYGLVAYSVGQRMHEIGIRLALGARASDIARMILTQGMRVAGIGSLIGLTLALPLPKIFAGMFAGMQFISPPATYAAMLLAMLFVGVAGTLLPARRAASVDPNRALREE
ncbi:MAG TPA: ABC transporter permease [Acidobacteriaceae bacterium]|nr:ABC transporter permease [Acidobacteriaceae bacterium]